MRVVSGHRASPGGAGPGRPVLALGNFDGVHVGHQALLAAARARGAQRAAPWGALTFTPHPLRVLAPPGPVPLTSDARRLELLAALGCEVVVVEPFDAALAAMPAGAFVDEVLVRGLGIGGVVVGPDFCYGHGRGGDVASLRAAGARHDFAVDVVAPVEVAGAVASSSRVRAALAAGDCAAAAVVLGRPWDVEGVVVHGAKRGRAIGVPTANVAPALPLPLPLGIYACWLEAGGARRPAVASLGTNPTFVEGGPQVLEVHVLDWDGDLYDQRVRVAFVQRLRGEEKYAGLEPLLAQIRLDIAGARAALAVAAAAG